MLDTNTQCCFAKDTTPPAFFMSVEVDVHNLLTSFDVSQVLKHGMQDVRVVVASRDKDVSSSLEPVTANADTSVA